jgi:predicted glutamine amidotransferase
MCGITGISCAKHSLEASLRVASAVDVLAREKNRGDDSYGLVFDTKKELFRVRGLGIIPIEKVLKSIKDKDIASNLVIGHVRAATVGAATVENAHPFLNENQDLALAHNGHVFDWKDIKEKLEKDNKHKFSSEVDSEALIHVWESNWDGKEDVSSFKKATENTFGEVKGTLNVIMAIPNMSSKSGGYLLAYSEGAVSFLKKDETVLIASVPLSKWGESDKEGWKSLPSGHWMLVKDGVVLAEEKLVNIRQTNYSAMYNGEACGRFSEYGYGSEEDFIYGPAGLEPATHHHQSLLTGATSIRSDHDKKKCAICRSTTDESERGLKRCDTCKEYFCFGEKSHFTWHEHPNRDKMAADHKVEKVMCPDTKNTHEVWNDKVIKCTLCMLSYCKGHMWDHPCFTITRKAKKYNNIREGLQVCPVGQHINDEGSWTLCSGCRKWYCKDHIAPHDCKVKFDNKLVAPEIKGPGRCVIDAGYYVQTCYCEVCNNSFCPHCYNNIDLHVGNLHKAPKVLEAE